MRRNRARAPWQDYTRHLVERYLFSCSLICGSSLAFRIAVKSEASLAFWNALNPLRCAVHALRKPSVAIHCHPFEACVSPMDAAAKIFWALAILLCAESL